MSNPYKRLLGLLPNPAQDVGQIIATHTDGVTVQLINGGTARVKGTGEVGTRVFIAGSTIIGPAPDLSGVDQEV